MVRTTFWTAQRHGQDWTDPDVARACDWLESFVDSTTWEARLDRAVTTYVEAGKAWRTGSFPSVFDPNDQIAWFFLQARTYSTDRALIEPTTASRVASILQRFGKDLALLKSIGGVEARAERLMRQRSAAPNLLFELLVALAYRRAGWHTVEFVEERPGQARTHEFNVFRQSSRWAVECKWMGVPQIAINERAHVEAMAAPVHQFARSLGLSLFVEVEFLDDSAVTPGSELINAVEAAMKTGAYAWRTPFSQGRIRLIDFSEARASFAHDDIFFGGSRMIEVLTSRLYDHDSQYSMRANWTESAHRPRFARSVEQASIIRWRNVSEKSERLKAKHLKKQVVDNLDQFPGDRPAVMHVGFDATTGRDIQARRDILNRLEMWDLDVRQSRLRWVYGHYLAPEPTTQRSESAAAEEAASSYRVNRHRTPQPLPNTLLLSDVVPKPGGYWMFPPA